MPKIDIEIGWIFFSFDMIYSRFNKIKNLYCKISIYRFFVKFNIVNVM